MAGAHEFGGGFGIPDVGGVLAEESDNAIENGFVGEGFGAAFAIENSDGDAPDALARDAPIGARGDHVGHALFAPGGIPLNFLDGVESFFAETFAVHADEPLFGSAEDEGVVAAPTVRIAVVDFGLSGESAVLLEDVDDDGVGVPNGFAEEFFGQHTGCAFGLEDAASGIDRAIDRDAVTLADDEIFLAVAGCGVHSARALFESDVIAVEA